MEDLELISVCFKIQNIWFSNKYVYPWVPHFAKKDTIVPFWHLENWKEGITLKQIDQYPFPTESNNEVKYEPMYKNLRFSTKSTYKCLNRWNVEVRMFSKSHIFFKTLVISKYQNYFVGWNYRKRDCYFDHTTYRSTIMFLFYQSITCSSNPAQPSAEWL